jgi:predicted nucleic acid-binding protein
MPKKISPHTCMLDTSAVVYHTHGHALQQTAVREAVTAAAILVPVFVRMEYLRGVLRAVGANGSATRLSHCWLVGAWHL